MKHQIEQLRDEALDMVLKQHGRFGETRIYRDKKIPKKEELDNVVETNTKTLLRDVYKKERKTVKDLLKQSFMDIMKNENMDVSQLNIEIEDKDIDTFFDILHEEH